MVVDLRSDTVTKPTKGMLEAMMASEVGDDIFQEDPTINTLEEKAAKIFGMESALFCPSGTMTNQIAINVHTRPGDEVICDQYAHIYMYEGGGVAKNSGVTCKRLKGDRGRISLNMLEHEINPDDVHKPVTSLVALENTSNKGGGSCYDLNEIRSISAWCKANQLKLHLDGARLYNAIVANDESPAFYGEYFNSISLCLSKGLGAPVGSLLIGDHEFIKRSRRVRKIFGGGMRQAGILAAAGTYALDHHVDRLKEDHEHAQIIGEAIQKVSTVLKVYPVETNIVIVQFKNVELTLKMLNYLFEKEIKTIQFDMDKIRLVTHLDVSMKMVDYIVDAIKNYQ